jgi:hypothetical protein
VLKVVEPITPQGGAMRIDGFHWTRVTSKLLRFLYEEVTLLPPTAQMSELVAAIDRRLPGPAPSATVVDGGRSEEEPCGR